MKTKYKVVVDTNLLIAGNFNTRSASRKILDRIVKGHFIHLWTDDIKKEHKFILSKVPKKQGYLDFVSQIYDQKYHVKNPPVIRISEDPDDDKYLACAKKGNADFIITADDHLLSIKKFGRTEIVRPSNFLKIAQNKSKRTKYRLSNIIRSRNKNFQGK